MVRGALSVAAHTSYLKGFLTEFCRRTTNLRFSRQAKQDSKAVRVGAHASELRTREEGRIGYSGAGAAGPGPGRVGARRNHSPSAARPALAGGKLP